MLYVCNAARSIEPLSSTSGGRFHVALLDTLLTRPLVTSLRSMEERNGHAHFRCRYPSLVQVGASGLATQTSLLPGVLVTPPGNSQSKNFSSATAYSFNSISGSSACSSIHTTVYNTKIYCIQLIVQNTPYLQLMTPSREDDLLSPDPPIRTPSPDLLLPPPTKTPP